jgi:hypothetical protein
VTDPAAWTWPGVDAVEARLGVTFTDQSDRDDATQALAAAVDYAVTNSSLVHALAAADATGPGAFSGRQDH